MTDTNESPAAPSKAAHTPMTAKQRMEMRLPYFQYNFSRSNPLRLAAEAGDIAAFRKAGACYTELMDGVVVEIIDSPDFIEETK